MAYIATVRLLDAPYRADKDYDYLWEAEGVTHPMGRICLVPFGAGNHGKYAVVTALREGTPTRPLKRVQALLPEDLRLTEEMLSLCFFLREHTLCSVGEAVRAAMPVSAFGLLSEGYFAAKPEEAEEDDLLPYLRENPGATVAAIEEVFGKGVTRRLSRLCKEGTILRRTLRRTDVMPKTQRVYRAALSGEALTRAMADPQRVKNEKQAAVLRFLADEGEATAEEIESRLGLSLSPVQTLIKQGLVLCETRTVERNPYAALAKKRDTSPVLLSPAQEKAYDTLSGLYRKGEAACALLYGVTGSGKTKVMMRLLDDVLAEGKQAILLVPEIALTPQAVGIFCSRYGERVSVLHSSLSTGERADAYRKILTGGTDLVIGTRSAVFAPLSRLGLIILDEEHEHTYKSDAAPRYHTRDVAAFRSAKHGALTVLASATPAIESYYKAENGKYTLVPLTERYGGAVLPKTEIVDMREELKAGNTSPISRLLLSALEQTAEAGKGAILFHGRRGYHHSILCKNCGEPLLCPHCSVSFTYHTGYTGSYLLCHACGTKKPLPEVCPACGGAHLSHLGAGTQKAEADLKALLPYTAVLRMDADTTGTKTAYTKILDKFRRGEAGVLLGTQMVTKGHDFPQVTLSGVVLADSSLYMQDFRAAERTFSLLTQVIGRAGRAAKSGEALAIVQTFSPTHPVIRLAATQDYPAFYKEELALRRALTYPPFCDIAEVFLSAAEETLLLKAAKEASDTLISLLKEKGSDLFFEVYGPLEPQAYKVAEKYRLKLMVKCRLTKRVRGLFGEFLTRFLARYPTMTATVDFNPTAT